MRDGASLGRAQALRDEPTDAERRLWSRLRRRQVGGWRFRRQHPVPPYILDFACLSAMLAVEADGDQHAGSEHDVRRDRYLERRGWQVLRFWNFEVMGNIDGVIDRIYYELSLRPLPTLPRAAGEGFKTSGIAAVPPPPPLAGEGWGGGRRRVRS